MNTRMKFTMTMILGVGLTALQTSAAQVWDIANNSVTDSRTFDFDQPRTLTINDILKFNSADAVAAGEAAGTYVLTSVVISVAGTGMTGTFQFHNTYETAGTVNSANYYGSQGLTFTAQGSSALQAMTHDFNSGAPYLMAAGETKSDTFTPTLAAPATTTLMTGLDVFTGSGYIESSARLAAGMDASADAGISLLSLASGTANISITYNYVPEPTCAALLGLGCAALALCRRRSVKA